MPPRRPLVLLGLMLSSMCTRAQTAPAPLALVDPLVGTQNGGNTTPGAQVPFGFVSFGPDMTSDSGFTSGYDPAAEIIGFSCTHESGTGGESKYGNFRTTPTVGELSPRNLLYPWKDERAEPGYYAVTLGQTGQQVRSELTATRLVAVSRYTFPAYAQANLLLDISSRIRLKGGRSGVPSVPMAATGGAVTLIDARHAEGFVTMSGGWNPTPYTLYFAAELSRDASAMGTWDEHRLYPNRLHAEGIDQTPRTPESYRNKMGAYFTFAASGRLGISHPLRTGWRKP